MNTLDALDALDASDTKDRLDPWDTLDTLDTLDTSDEDRMQAMLFLMSRLLSALFVGYILRKPIAQSLQVGCPGKRDNGTC